MPKAETRRTTQLINRATALLDEESPMTLRQLFYRMVSAAYLENTRGDYARLSRLMTIARQDGRCDWDHITDRTRPEYAPNVWADAGAYARTIQRSYRKDYWNMQRTYVEVWSEKDSIISSIQDLTDELGVTVRVGRGFQSTTRTHEIAGRFDTIKKSIEVFYLGDFDPSGVDIERDLKNRVGAQLGRARRSDEKITIRRLAIHAEDIRKFNLPPLRVKVSDSRATGFIANHGRQCVELDALPPKELRRRIRQAVMKYVDKESWERSKIVEAAEADSIMDFSEKLQNLQVGM